MLRTSNFRTGFLAIALSATALVTVTVPASAHMSQVFGGNSRIVAQMHPMQATTSMQPSREAIHELGPKKVADLPPQIPTPGPKASNTGMTTIKNAQFPAKDLPSPDVCATHPYLQFCHHDPIPGPPNPPIPHPPIPECEALPISMCHKKPDPNPDPGPTGNNSNHPSGPIVIVAPPVQVPVYVPGPAAYGTPVRVNTGAVAATQPQPVVTPHCMTAADIPALAAGIDQLLPTAKLSEADMTQVTQLRQTIQVLATDGKVPAARDVEEIAMNMLGYQKVWLRCGQGVFDWEPLPAATQAQAK